jgi:hypothetical protein
MCVVAAMSACWWIEQPAIAENPLRKSPLFALVEAVSCNDTNRLRESIAKGADVNQHFGSLSETALFRAKRSDVALLGLWGDFSLRG